MCNHLVAVQLVCRVAPRHERHQVKAPGPRVNVNMSARAPELDRLYKEELPSLRATAVWCCREVLPIAQLSFGACVGGVVMGCFVVV